MGKRQAIVLVGEYSLMQTHKMKIHKVIRFHFISQNVKMKNMDIIIRKMETQTLIPIMKMENIKVTIQIQINLH